MRTSEEILYLYQQRKARLDPLHAAAMDVRSAYYNEITLPMPELDRSEKPLVPNLLFAAGEQKAMRVASTMPDLYYPSKNPGVALQDKRARDRRLVNLAWWDYDRMKLKLRKRARHMVYYAASPVMLRPHFGDKRPTWQTRNPLSCLAPEMDTGDLCPEDVIFTYAKSYAWLSKRYPGQMAQFGMGKEVQDGTFAILEYQDAEDFVLCAVGDKVTNTATPGMYPTNTRVEMCVELEREKNRVGRCTAVLAGGIGLDHARGSFDGTIGIWQAMGKLMALEAIGTQRSIWPEEWLIDDPTGDGAKIVTHADPLHGVTGHVTGGKLQTIVPQMNPNGMNLINVMERGIRVEGGIPPELGGESGSNIRTGKRGDQILSSVLDFPLQEMQEILAVALQEEDKIAVAIDKAYFPTSKSVYISATAGEITYEADTLFDTDAHFVRYSHAGVDAQGLVIELGQLVGTGLISKRSAMESHPAIEDPQSEFDRMTQEHLDDALLGGLAQMAADPTMAAIIADVAIRVRESETQIPDAVLEVHKAMQEMQAQQAQAQQQAAGPMGAPSPDQQPGMAGGPPTIGEAPQSLQNLTGLLQNLRKGPISNVPNQLGIAS